MIFITAGEPAGIGPDLCVLWAQAPSFVEAVVIADPQVLVERARLLGKSLTIIPWQPGDPAGPARANTLRVWPMQMKAPVQPGILNPENAPAVLQSLNRAVEACLEAPDRMAMVTGPIHKGVINVAGISFTGHTEYLAALTHTELPVMLLAAPALRVALVTTHLPLSQVSQAITPARLYKTLVTLHQDLKQRFKLEKPRILVSGLNPHAGEGGHLGREELDIIQPVIAACQQEGMAVQGPLAADTLFTPYYLNQADAVLTMYHDQGLPVLKYSGFGEAVNVTLGLPIVRTSVDHGTALEKAGTGAISLGSFQAALQMAQGLLRPI